jgi:hypothetical protein
MDQANVDSAKEYVVGFLIHGDVSVANRLADPDLCVYTGLSRSGAIRGLEVYSELIQGFSTAIPVLSFTIEDSYCGEEFAVVRIKGTRHFRHDIWDIKANGEMFEFLKKSPAPKIKTWRSCSHRSLPQFCELKRADLLATKTSTAQRSRWGYAASQCRP